MVTARCNKLDDVGVNCDSPRLDYRPGAVRARGVGGRGCLRKDPAVIIVEAKFHPGHVIVYIV